MATLEDSGKKGPKLVAGGSTYTLSDEVCSVAELMSYHKKGVDGARNTVELYDFFTPEEKNASKYNPCYKVPRSVPTPKSD